MSQHRLGIPVKLAGAPGLRPHDSRRWQNNPHLSVSLAYVRDILEYLHSRDIHFYRLSGQLAPYLTHPAMPQFHRQIEECPNELTAIGDLARLYQIRLTMHPGYYIQLNSPDPERVERSIQELDAAARLLDAMGLDTNAVIVIHVGGVYGDKEESGRRFIQNFERIRHETKRRLALENDDRHFGVAETLWIHKHTGIRLVLDTLHHRCVNSANVSTLNALASTLATWPADQTPKIHFSSPRTAMRVTQREGVEHVQMPLINQHSDFIHAFEFIDLIQGAQDAGLRPFDVMLEAKGKDLALLRLREQIGRFAPGLKNLVV